MKASFAFNKAQSPVARLSAANVTSHPKAQYMAMCHFDNVYFEFDRTQNYKPSMVFEGEVERLDAIDTKFPHDVDTVFFNKNKPRVRYDYQMDEQQLATLAGTGFWSEDGVRMPELFTSAKFQLELDATVDEISNAYASQDAPIFNVNVEHPYDNVFTAEQYEGLETRIVRNVPEENKAMEHKAYENYTPAVDIEAEVAAAKALVAEQQAQAKMAEYKPLTAEEIEMNKKSKNVSEFVNEHRERLTVERDMNNATYDAEQKRLAEEQSKAEAAADSIRDNVVSNKPAEVETIVEPIAEANAEIFSAAETDADEEMSDEVLDFMAKLGVAAETSVATAEKKDDNKNGSGNASGAQTNGTYTFEDQSTAQFEERADAGVGNEKPDEDVDDVDLSDMSEEARERAERKREEEKRRKVVSLGDAANMSVPRPADDSKSDRSK